MTEARTRITVSIKTSLETKVRMKQADMITKTKKNISFSQTVAYLLQKGLNAKK